MSSDSIRQLLDKATDAMRSGKYSDALKVLDDAMELAPDDSDVYGLMGICYAQTGRAEPASQSFRKAVSLDRSPKTLFNLAVHQYNCGDKADAVETLSECLKLDQNNADAKRLLAKIDEQDTDAAFAGHGVSVAPNELARKRRYGFGRKHMFAVLAENQKEWVQLGWTVVGMSILATILVKLFFPLTAPATPDPKSMLFGYKPVNSPGAFATIGFFVTTVLASMIWTSLDLIDRRGRALWMVPMMICCFALMPFLPQTLYMAVGRREGNP